MMSIIENIKAVKSIFIGLLILFLIFITGTILIDGFGSYMNLRSMLVLASFLGFAVIGQTLVALLGGLDLSIPFVIGSANIFLASLFNTDLNPLISCIIVMSLGGLIGLINGLLSFRIQGQSLIMTLGIGFTLVGLTQIITSIGSIYGGNVFGKVPPWLSNFSSLAGKTFGIAVPPMVLVWLIVSAIIILFMKKTIIGREFYAIGGNPQAAKLIRVSQFKIWVFAYIISGLTASATGMFLLGFSGGGFVGVGDQYLFLTVAAVVIGGTSLLGGTGGYGSSFIGVCILTVLTSLLVGLGFNYEGQQAIFGLMIIPLVAMYARSKDIRLQI